MKLKKILSEVLSEIDEESNLNDNFKKWFGNSKIGSSSSPTVCYHGSTANDIKIFDISNIGKGSGNYGHYGYGIYFSEDIREAKTYGTKIYECYLKISNPFFGNNEQILELKNNGIDNIDDLIVKSIDFDSFKAEFKNNNIIYTFLDNVEKHNLEYAWDNLKTNNESSDIDFDMMNDISNIIEYTTFNDDVNGVPEYIIDDLDKLNITPKLNKGFEFEQSLHWITDLGNRSKEVTDVIKQLGYDGVHYGSEIIVFDAKQIKSIQNDGSWDVNDANIYS